MHPHHESDQGHSHGQEHRHGHTDHGDHVHEVCASASISNMLLQVMHVQGTGVRMQASIEMTFLGTAASLKSLQKALGIEGLGSALHAGAA